jgi:hypothetical protein
MASSYGDSKSTERAAENAAKVVLMENLASGPKHSQELRAAVGPMFAWAVTRLRGESKLGRIGSIYYRRDLAGHDARARVMYQGGSQAAAV